MKKINKAIIGLSTIVFTISLFMPLGPAKDESGRPTQPIVGYFAVYKIAKIPMHLYQEYSTYKNEPNMISGYLGEIILRSLSAILISIAHLTLISTPLFLFGRDKANRKLVLFCGAIIATGFVNICINLFGPNNFKDFFMGTYFWLSSFLINLFGLSLLLKESMGDAHK